MQPHAATPKREPRRTARASVPRAAETDVSQAVLILPGLGNNAADYEGLVGELQHRGLAAAVVPIARWDWARNAAGLRYAAYWRGALQPRPTVDWYLNRLNQAMQKLKREVDGRPVTLLAHSAGGWLGRLYLKDFGTAGVTRFVSLGSPHQPPPPGVVDQTRGILTYCSDTCPGAFHPEVEYTTVAGRYIKGAPLGGPGSLQQRLAGAGYAQQCGRPDVWGDAIVPLATASLAGAREIVVDGVYHSPLGASRDPAPIAAAEEVLESQAEGRNPASSLSAVLNSSRRWYG